MGFGPPVGVQRGEHSCAKKTTALAPDYTPGMNGKAVRCIRAGRLVAGLFALIAVIGSGCAAGSPSEPAPSRVPSVPPTAASVATTAHVEGTKLPDDSSTGSTSTVRWVNEPAHQPTPLPSATPPPPLYPTCQVSQLQATPGPGMGAMEMGSVPVVLKNVGTSDCSLSGYPASLVGIRADGTSERLAPTDGAPPPFGGGEVWPANLKPGQSGWLTIVTARFCPATMATPSPATMFTSAAIGVPGGGVVTSPAEFDAVCGVWVTAFGVPEPASATSEYVGLSAHITAPQTVRAESDFLFTLTLTNSESQPVALDPCPVYEEGFAPAKGSMPFIAPIQTYRLNCTSVSAVPARGSVVYQMRITAPKLDKTSDTLMTWTVPNSGAFAVTHVTVSP